MSGQLDKTQLMLEAGKGNQQAFQTLAQALTQRMFHLTYRLMGYRHDAAEDAVQDALIKLWTSAPNWQPTGSVDAYASRLVYTSCMDIHRRTKITDELPEDIAQPDTILDTILNKEQRKVLIDAIDQLPERQREAILLHYMGENSQRSVAAMLGTTEKSIERLIARGRKRLRELLPSAAA